MVADNRKCTATLENKHRTLTLHTQHLGHFVQIHTIQECVAWSKNTYIRRKKQKMLTDICCVSCLHNGHAHTSSTTCDKAWFLTQERCPGAWTRQETRLIIGAPCLESEWEQRQRQKAAAKSGSFPAACSLHRKSKRHFHPKIWLRFIIWLSDESFIWYAISRCLNNDRTAN